MELGVGVLNWNRSERVSDRYGSVCLFTSTDEEQRVELVKDQRGLYGRLVAVVKETRQSYHIGDYDHQVEPTTPYVGEKFILGEGTLFFEGEHVGLLPKDGRHSLWLNIHALYRVHFQTVTLSFEELT